MKQIEVLREEDIDYSDIPETDEAFWEKAEVRSPTPKDGVYLRLYQDLLDWLKGQGPGYQTRINANLRAYMETHHSSAGVSASNTSNMGSQHRQEIRRRKEQEESALLSGIEVVRQAYAQFLNTFAQTMAFYDHSVRAAHSTPL